MLSELQTEPLECCNEAISVLGLQAQTICFKAEKKSKYVKPNIFFISYIKVNVEVVSL